MEKKRDNALVTSGWWQSFCGRHPNLTLRAPAPLSKARAQATDPAMLTRYFDLLEEVLTENDLLDRPCQVFNMDESGMPLDPSHVKVVAEHGVRNPVAPSSGDKAQITIVACVSASGSCMPPTVILDRKTLPPRFTKGDVPGSIYGLSSRGWIDQELFDGWFVKHFLKHAPAARPLLLLLDGHSSHFCPDTVRLAAKEKVILFALPPNTTHLSQPLDKGCFGPLKEHWKEECHEFMSCNPGVVVSRDSFSQLFSKAWMKAMTMKNVTAGFKVCGIFPFDRDAMTLPVDRRDPMKTLASKSGLAYIPLFSPAKGQDSQLKSSSHRRSRSRQRHGQSSRPRHSSSPQRMSSSFSSLRSLSSSSHSSSGESSDYYRMSHRDHFSARRRRSLSHSGHLSSWRLQFSPQSGHRQHRLQLSRNLRDSPGL